MKAVKMTIWVSVFALVLASVAQAAVFEDWEDSFYVGGDQWNTAAQSKWGGLYMDRTLITDSSNYWPIIGDGSKSGRVRNEGIPFKLFKDSKETITDFDKFSFDVSLALYHDSSSGTDYLKTRMIISADSDNPQYPNHAGIYWRFWQPDANSDCELLIWAQNPNDGSWGYQQTGIKGFGYHSDVVTVSGNANSKNHIDIDIDWDNSQVTITGTDMDDGVAGTKVVSGPWNVILNDGTHPESVLISDGWFRINNYGSADDPNSTNGGRGIVIIDNITVTPEPATIGLLCLGLLGLAKRRRA